MKYEEITEKIIGCAMRIHSAMGNGFQEIIYQKCMAIEMRDAGLIFECELMMPVHYKQEKVGERRVDFLIEGKVLVELKAVSKLENVHLAQALNYLEAFNLETGLLMNFGNKSLEFKDCLIRSIAIEPDNQYDRPILVIL